MNIGDRVRTTQNWADRYNRGQILRGELFNTARPGSCANRTYSIALDQAFLGYYTVLSFRPTDLELET